MWHTIGNDGEITQRNDLHGSPFEVVLGSKAWICDRLEQAQAIIGKPAQPTIYPVRD